jgi:hypothetical protein
VSKKTRCGKDIPEGKKYCNQECLKRAIALRKHGTNEDCGKTDSSIETVLKYMGID